MAVSRKRPARLMLLFAAAALCFSATFVWLAWRLMEQERQLERDRAQQRIEAIAAAAGDELTRRLAGLEDDLDRLAEASTAESLAPDFGDRLPRDAVLVIFEREQVRAYPRARVLFLPRIGPHEEPSLFAAAEQLEFDRRDSAAAVQRLRPLAASPDVSVRAGALIRIARNLRKREDFQNALVAYDELASLGGVAVSNSNAALLGRYGRCLLLEETGSPKLREAAASFLREIDDANWDLDAGTYHFYRAECRRWLGDQPGFAPPPGRLRLSLAVDALDGENARVVAGGEPAGRRDFRAGDESMLLLWRSTPRRFVGLAAGRSLFEPPKHALVSSGVEARLIDGPRRRSRDHDLARYVVTPGLPWTLEIRGSPFTGSASSIAGTRILSLTGIAAAILFTITTYFIARATLREIKLARLQSNFVAAVSHDFRTPLTSIRQISEMLDDGRVINEERRKLYHGQLRWESERLEHLVENLLDFQRLERGTGDGRFEPISVQKLVEQVVNDFNRELRGRRDEIRLENGSDCGSVRGDGEMLGRALWNLLDNAVKYSRDSESISVTVRSERSKTSISVTDRGLGIPAHEIESIFARFVRGESARITGAPGSGLGLSIVREIVEAHRGSIDVASTPGGGSTFTITLPAEARS